MTRPTDKTKEPSFTALVRPHLGALYSLAYRLTGHREDAQDLVQDVLLKLHAQTDRLANVDRPRTWMCRVMYNQFVDNQRRSKARRLRLVESSVYAENPDLAPALEPATEDLVAGEFTITQVQAAVEQLSDDHQIVIKLHDVEGYTIPEIAEITGISHGTLKSRRYRARERLQKLLAEGPDSADSASSDNRGDENDALRRISAKPGSTA